MTEQVKIENPEIGIAYLVDKLKNVIHKGITTPPPPIPAIVHRAIITDNTIRPIISCNVIGKTPLRSQICYAEHIL